MMRSIKNEELTSNFEIDYLLPIEAIKGSLALQLAHLTLHYNLFFLLRVIHLLYKLILVIYPSPASALGPILKIYI